MIHEIEHHAHRHGLTIASTASLRVYVSEWENGRRPVSTEHAAILRAVLGLTDQELFPDAPMTAPSDEYEELAARVDTSRRMSRTLVGNLLRQTELLRTMDRQTGAVGMVDQVQAHLARLGDILAFTVLPDARRPVALALAGAASMAAWQALDVRAAGRAWRHYELAKSAPAKRMTTYTLRTPWASRHTYWLTRVSPRSVRNWCTKPAARRVAFLVA